MSEQYLSEIRIVAFNFAPKGWALCNGQILAIAQNQALFALLGTTYGGDGISTFGLPNLQGKAPIHTDYRTYPLGQSAGATNITLTTQQIPQHTHSLVAAPDAANASSPDGATLALSSDVVGPAYSPAAPNAVAAPQAIGNTGGGQPHNNQQPYLALNFVIALVGVFPSRN